MPHFGAARTGIRTVPEVNAKERGLESIETEVNAKERGMGINATNPLGQPFWHNRMFDVWNKLFEFCAVAVHTITDIFNR